MPRIGIRWDSITWGHCDYKNWWWVEILRKYFYAKKESISIINLWVSWDSTRDILKRFEIEYKARIPEIVIFSIGINDSLILSDTWKNLVEQTEFKNNLEKLKKMALQYTNTIIFLWLSNVNESLLTPIPRDKNRNYYNKEIEKYNKILEDFCNDNSIDFIPLYWDFLHEELEDWLHPWPLGHQKISEKVKKILENKLRKI